MDSNVKKDLIDEINHLKIEEGEEELKDWVFMADFSGIKSSIGFEDGGAVVVDANQISIEFGGATLTYHHNEDQKFYRLMRIVQPPHFEVKILGVQHTLNNTVRGTGELVISFDNEAQLDVFQRQLGQAGYSPQF